MHWVAKTIVKKTINAIIGTIIFKAIQSISFAPQKISYQKKFYSPKQVSKDMYFWVCMACEHVVSENDLIYDSNGDKICLECGTIDEMTPIKVEKEFIRKWQKLLR